MPLSIFDIFSIGIGPSSSHTVGPMRAAREFLIETDKQKLLSKVVRIQVELFGSLALTGIGHSTDKAVILGLEGEIPEKVKLMEIEKIISEVKKSEKINLLGKKIIPFEKGDLIFNKRKRIYYHPNSMKFTVYDKNKRVVWSQMYYSIGGGFVISDDSLKNGDEEKKVNIPYPFSTGKELLQICSGNDWNISDVMMENEKVFNCEERIKENILEIWAVMREAVLRGCSKQGELPGGLHVKRRSAVLHKKLTGVSSIDPTRVFDWVSLFALAVSEENAGGGRVVTAPTSGSAGVIPAVLHYYERYFHHLSLKEIVKFFMTAGAVGILFKKGASISGAEVGCQAGLPYAKK